MNKIRCNVLIIGAGPAGASLGLFLSGKGLNVILLERKSHIEVPVRCAEYVPLNFLSLFDFRPDGIENEIRNLKTYINFNPVSTTRLPGYMMNRKIFTENLILRFIKKGGRLFTNTKASGISGGEVTTYRSGKKILITPDIIAGADGPLSLTGKTIGSVNSHFMLGLNCRIVYEKTSDADAGIFFSRDIAGGFGWFFPKNNYANIGFGIDPLLSKKVRTASGNPRDLLDFFIAKILPSYVPKHTRQFTTGLIPVSGIVKNPVKGNIILTGDAAGLCNPVTGSGIYNAVCASKIASHYITESLFRQDLKILYQVKDAFFDYFASGINRALRSRNEMTEKLGNLISDAEFDNLIKNTWITFKDYWKKY